MAEDFDKGGRFPQKIRVYLGPTMGWKEIDSPVYYQYTFDGAGSTPLTGSRGPLVSPDWFSIRDWIILANTTGSCEFDIYKVTLSDYLAGATVGPSQSICGTAKPTLTSARSATSSTLTGWDTSVDQDDVLVFNLSSVSTVQQVTLILRCVRELNA